MPATDRVLGAATGTITGVDRFQGALSSLAIKAPCRAATTANITLSGEQTIDGVACVTNDRVLVKNQTNQVDNGIYNCDTSTWQRTPDFDSSKDVASGAIVMVGSGTISADRIYELTTNDPITIGTSSITFVIYSSPVLSGIATEYLDGTGVFSTPKSLEAIIVAVGDETTAITTGTAKVTFRMPYAFTLTEIPRASLNVVSSSGTPTFDINESGVSVLGANKLSIDANEKTSTTAAVPTTLADTSIADDAEMTIDIDVQGTGAAGPKIYIIGRRA